MKLSRNKIFIFFTILIFLLLSCNTISEDNNVFKLKLPEKLNVFKNCPFPYKGLEDYWATQGIRKDIPDELVQAYSDSYCNAFMVVQGNDALAIQKALEEFSLVVKDLSEYSSYLFYFKSPSDLESIEWWLATRKVASVIPEKYEAFELEPECPLDIYIESAGGCSTRILVKADSFKVEINGGNSVIQTYKDFTLYRYCFEHKILLENVEDLFSCPVAWIEQHDKELGTRAFTELAILSYTWTK